MIIDAIPVNKLRSLFINKVQKVTPRKTPNVSEVAIITDVKSNSELIAAIV